MTKTPDGTATSRRWVVALVLIMTAVAVGLRAHGNTAGLPHEYAADEWDKAAASRGLARNGFTHTNGQPSFMYNTLWLISVAARPWEERWIRSADLPHGESRRNLRQSYYVWLGRWWMAILGALTVPLVFWLGKETWSAPAGLVAGGLYAVLPLPVVASHFIKEDTPLALAVTLAVVLLVRLAKAPSTGRYVLAGLAIGAAAGTKYPGVTLLAVLVLVHAVLPDRSWRGFGWALLAAVVGYAAASPEAVIRAGAVLDGWGNQALYLGRGHHDGLVLKPGQHGWSYYLTRAFLPGVTAPVLAAAAAGAAVAWRRHRLVALVLVVWVVSYWLGLEIARAKPYPFAARYALPVVPALAALAGVAVVWTAARARGSPPALFAALIFAWPAWSSLQYARHFEPDTRDLARVWIAGNVPPGEIVLRSGYSPWLDDRVYDVQDFGPGTVADLEAEGARGRSTVVVSSFRYDRYLENPGQRTDWDDVLATLFTRAEPLATFRPAYRSFGFSNPTIRIYRVDDETFR